MSSKNPKTNNPTSVVFFGTGPTSLEALQCLAENFTIELIITKPPALNSAGKKFKNPVHLWAEKNNIKLVNPTSKDELAAQIKYLKLHSKIGVVLDYGMIIPQLVIDKFPLGIVNSHFSLLPAYRGADPIRSAILNGDKTSGVTIISITSKLDDGPILTWAEESIGQMNATQLREKLSNINCALLPETIRLYLNNELEPIEQDGTKATYTKKLKKEDGRLDPSKAAEQLMREVRAYTGWPKSYFEWQDKLYIVHNAQASTLKATIGGLEVIDKKLIYGCGGGSLEITEIQPAGKPKMNASAFINGYM